MGTVHRETLLLMRNDIAIDKERYNIYRDELLILILSQKRIIFGCWKKCIPILGNLKGVRWCDGNLSKVDNIISKESLNMYAENMICANKQKYYSIRIRTN